MIHYTIAEALQRWEGTVRLIEEKAYTHADEAEMENDISVRQVFTEFASLTREEQQQLDALDERFRRALYPALHAANLVHVYQHATIPYWWWHVEEGQ